MNGALELYSNLNRRGLAGLPVGLGLLIERLDVYVVACRERVAAFQSSEGIPVPDSRGDQAIGHALLQALVNAGNDGRGAGLVLPDLLRCVEQVPEIRLNSVLKPVKTVRFVNEPSAGRDAFLEDARVILIGAEGVDVMGLQGLGLRAAKVFRCDARELLEIKG